MNDQIKTYFETNPKAEEIFSTADGNLFVAEHFAHSYAATLEDKKVKKHTREQYAAAAPQGKAPSATAPQGKAPAATAPQVEAPAATAPQGEAPAAAGDVAPANEPDADTAEADTASASTGETAPAVDAKPRRKKKK